MMQDVTVILIVIDYENTYTLKIMRPGNCMLKRIGRGLKTPCESEDTALIERALHADFSPHHLAQLLADGKTQTCTAVSSRGGAVCLGKGIKNVLLDFRRNPNPCVTDFKTQACIIFLVS
jgi:hypothetical protein